MLNFLNTNVIKFYSIKPKAQRPLKFVVEDMPSHYDINETSNCLNSTDIMPLQINKLNSFKNNHKPLPLCFISTENNETIIQHMNNIWVFIEARHVKGYKQCYRYQRSYDYRLTPRCVKCGKNH